ncbi:hypothetical protein [Methylobacterium oxalidis]|uniref:Uncharacterized protein n=1 Tax=Methylobacterium oxalidis TaxID=944322 RepID=A0A512IYI5_9HYPH|nr:hypothetical protein [Methylobacterium oxalidis]GEP02778.1 hypothetical protein MOX02_08160 [Methylobacterium oxalidis]GJE34273.1 hypothetical protein LDDCCGHA_4482 [Methylobacterium oxalidis]GLS66822.1 hypothetical protein GCM10007888_52050 [Methylobacterium oxalidis]
MYRSDLNPPHTGPASDPILYGIASGLAELFPPVEASRPTRREADTAPESDEERDETAP